MAGMRAGSRRVRADAARGDGTGRSRRTRHPHVAKSASADFPVVVIGCGEAGLLAGIRLKEAGVPFTIIEKDAGVGGTWWQNSYPGARVDVGNHFYCYSFEPTDQWTHFFAEQPQLQGYFQRVMDKYDIGRHVPWNYEVTEAYWDDASATWTVRARDRNGSTTTLSARAVISGSRRSSAASSGNTGTGPSSPVAFLRRVGPFSTCAENAWLIGAGASRFQIAPATSSSAPPNGCFPTRTTTPKWAPECNGRAAPAVLRSVVSVPAVLAGL